MKLFGYPMGSLWFVAALLLFIGRDVRAQSYQWVNRSEGSSLTLAIASGTGVVSDKNGNVYATGTFKGPAKFGTQILAGTGETDIYVVKYNAVGEFQWIQTGGGIDLDTATAIAVDASNNVYVLGVFRQNATFSSKTETSQGDADVFLVKYDPQGVLQWFIRMGGAGVDRATGLTIDGKGGIYITGTFAGAADFLGQTMSSVGMSDMFTLKMNLDHVLQWYKQAGDFGAHTEGLGIKHDGSGNAYVTGHFTTTFTFGADGQLIDAGKGDFFIAKYESNGDQAWAKRGGGTEMDLGRSISSDQIGNLYVVGVTEGNATFGSTTLTHRGESDGFISMYRNTGEHVWTRQLAGNGNDIPMSIKTDLGGGSYVVGSFTGTLDLDANDLVTKGNEDSVDMFVAKFRADGSVDWASRTGGAWNDVAASIWIDRDGGIFTTGTYSDEIYFGEEIPGNKITGGFNEAFIARVKEPLAVSVGQIGAGPYCPGSTIDIPFTTTGPFNDGNTFVAVLSDVEGSFDIPEVIGTLAGTGSGTINATIPAGTASGTKYRIRIIASDPSTIGPDNGANITITSTPTVSVEVDGASTICVGDSVKLTGPEGFSTYLWSNGGAGRSIWVKQAGEYTLTASNGSGCTGTSTAVTISTYEEPAKPTITQQGAALTSSDAVSYEWLDASDNVVGSAKTFTPTANGAYRVRITNANGCKATSDAFQFSGLAVPTENEMKELSVYPHPTDGAFTVELTAARAGAVRLTLTDALGRTVLTRNETADGGDYRVKIDIGSLPAGVYFIDVESGGRKWSRQVMKR